MPFAAIALMLYSDIDGVDDVDGVDDEEDDAASTPVDQDGKRVTLSQYRIRALAPSKST